MPLLALEEQRWHNHWQESRPEVGLKRVGGARQGWSNGPALANPIGAGATSGLSPLMQWGRSDALFGVPLRFRGDDACMKSS
jgi:hypothetical protein